MLCPRVDAADHIITWLARMVTNSGVKPGSPASEAIPALQKKTGGHNLSRHWQVLGVSLLLR
jgi:hypothetical protein